MGKLIDHLVLTLAFFSRIPLPAFMGSRISHDARLSDTAALFPIAGIIISILPAIVWFSTSLVLPSMVAAGLAILVGVLITGGLHEDGLADCADGLGATHEREGALEIMRDSTIGTYGGLALVISVGLRWAALASLAPLSGLCAIVIAYCASRSAMTIAMQYSSYARSDGLGAQAEGIPEYGFIIASFIAALVAVLFGGFAGITSFALGFATAFGFLQYMQKRLGGYTGDGLGAMQQICEITIFITLTGFWS